MARIDPVTKKLAVFHDAAVLEHDTGYGFFEAEPSSYLDVPEAHPENAARLRNILSVLRRGPIAGDLDWFDGPPATRADLERFHEPDYLDGLAAIPEDGTRRPTSTTVLGAGGFAIARQAAGLAVAAARHVWSGASDLAYVPIRPPGHHAQTNKSDGYCFLNNIGVAIQALRQEGLTRAAVIDWDVHHGNGTEQGFYGDPDILTVSMHMDHGAWGPSHQQTGGADQVGAGAGRGANLNVPLPFGSGDALYKAAFDRLVVPTVEAHRPEVLFIACGQDANQFDPNGRQCLTMAGFNALGRRARALADRLCGGRMVLVQEGGYALSYTAYCLHATLDGVLGLDGRLEDPIAFLPDRGDGTAAVLDAIAAARAKALAGG